MDKIRDIAEYALETLKKAGADKASCLVSRSRKDEFSVEANEFTLMRTLFSDSLNLKAITGGRKGVTVINKLDKESIAAAVADCIALASSASPDDAEDIAEKTENKSFSQNIGGADMDKLFSRTKDFLKQVRGECPKVVLERMTTEFNGTQETYVNSNGVEFSNEAEYYQILTEFSAKEGEKSASYNGYCANLNSLDIPVIDLSMHRALLQESERSLDTRIVDGKFIGKVILTPHCDDMIWQTIINEFLSSRVMVTGTSRWKDALGTKVADSKLTMRAAPLNPAIVAGERFTADGFESRDIDLIKNGVLTSFALSLYGANKTGKPRAGNTAFDNIEVLPGEMPLAEMIKSVDRGILLNRFSGAQPGPGGDISGVAKNSFLIENGVITDAIQETMISFNIVDILQNIPAISLERSCNGIRLLPWCCFDGITISGGN